MNPYEPTEIDASKGEDVGRGNRPPTLPKGLTRILFVGFLMAAFMVTPIALAYFLYLLPGVSVYEIGFGPRTVQF